MDHRDNLNRFALLDVADRVRIEVPQSITPVQEFFMIVADAWRLAQSLQGFISFGSQALGSVGAILGDIEQDLAEVGFRFRRKTETPFHERTAFFLTRRRSSIS